jgi:hypothetical protein
VENRVVSGLTELLSIKDNLEPDFKILEGLPDYIAIEEHHQKFDNVERVRKYVRSLTDFGTENKLSRISFLIDCNTSYYSELRAVLLDNGFEKFALRVEVKRNLDKLPGDLLYQWRSVASGGLTESSFAKMWEQCMAGSANTVSTLTIQEHMNSVKAELGKNWGSSCYAVYDNGKPLGISIPHIEPGTKKEGRLFYIGLLPEARGKRKSTLIHLESLLLLKRMGAEYYIGSTHENNLNMQRVFQKNGCHIRGKTESYYYYYFK